MAATNGVPAVVPAVGLRIVVGDGQIAEIKLPVPVTEAMLFILFSQLADWYRQQFIAEHPASGIVLPPSGAVLPRARGD